MEELKKELSKYKSLTLPVVVGIVAVLISAFVIVPQFLSYLEVRKQSAQLENKVKFLENKTKELESLDGNETQKNLQLTLSILPAQPDVPVALTILQNILTQSNLTLKNAEYGLTGRGAGKNKYVINITALGQLDSMRTFLAQLEHAPQVYEIESINIDFQDGGVESEMPVGSYFEPLPKTAPSEEKPVAKLTDQEKQLLQQLSSNASQFSLGSALDTSSVPLGKENPFQ